MTGNARLSLAIYAVKIFGRTVETMQELYDSLQYRREQREILRRENQEFSLTMAKNRRKLP